MPENANTAMVGAALRDLSAELERPLQYTAPDPIARFTNAIAEAGFGHPEVACERQEGVG
jgi:hypothetical protein